MIAKVLPNCLKVNKKENEKDSGKMNAMRLFQVDSELDSQCEVLQKKAKYIQVRGKNQQLVLFLLGKWVMEIE